MKKRIVDTIFKSVLSQKKIQTDNNFKLYFKIVFFFGIVYSQVSNFIINEQHGFMCGRSFETSLGIFTNFISNNLKRGQQLNALFAPY